jgi:glycogen synthase
MHIGIFTDTYYPAINGVSASTLYFTEELARRGHHVSIFCPRYKGTENEVRDYTKPGYSIYRCFGLPPPNPPEDYF